LKTKKLQVGRNFPVENRLKSCKKSNHRKLLQSRAT